MPGESKGEVCGWHYATNQPVCLRWQNGVINYIGAAEDPPKDVWLAPGLFDTQVNGYSGIDFQQDNLTVNELLSATRRLRAAGCPRFLLTLVTDDWEKLTSRLRHLRWARGQSTELQSAIV